MAIKIVGGADIRARPVTVDMEMTCQACGATLPRRIYGVPEDDVAALGGTRERWLCHSESCGGAVREWVSSRPRAVER